MDSNSQWHLKIMISDWSLKNRCETDYPDQSNQKQNWHTRFKTEQKQNSSVKIATEGNIFLEKKIRGMGPFIENVGKFSRFLTPTALPSAFTQNVFEGDF